MLRMNFSVIIGKFAVLGKEKPPAHNAWLAYLEL